MCTPLRRLMCMDYFSRRADPDRIAKRLIGQLERLGHTLSLRTAQQDPTAAIA